MYTCSKPMNSHEQYPYSSLLLEIDAHRSFPFASCVVLGEDPCSKSRNASELIFTNFRLLYIFATTVYIYTHVYLGRVYIYIYTYIRAYLHRRLYVQVFYTYIITHIYVYVYVYIYICLHMYIPLRRHVYTYMHTESISQSHLSTYLPIYSLMCTYILSLCTSLMWPPKR